MSGNQSGVSQLYNIYIELCTWSMLGDMQISSPLRMSEMAEDDLV
jgi:hypothetical protein